MAINAAKLESLVAKGREIAKDFKTDNIEVKVECNGEHVRITAFPTFKAFDAELDIGQENMPYWVVPASALEYLGDVVLEKAIRIAAQDLNMRIFHARYGAPVGFIDECSKSNQRQMQELLWRAFAEKDIKHAYAAFEDTLAQTFQASRTITGRLKPPSPLPFAIPYGAAKDQQNIYGQPLSTKRNLAANILAPMDYAKIEARAAVSMMPFPNIVNEGSAAKLVAPVSLTVLQKIHEAILTCPQCHNKSLQPDDSIKDKAPGVDHWVCSICKIQVTTEY